MQEGHWGVFGEGEDCLVALVEFAFNPDYIYDLPDGHKFPISKYQLVHDQLIYEGTITPNQVYDPGLINEIDILRVHTKEYWNKVRNLKLTARELRKIGLPLNEISVMRSRNSVAGTYMAATKALDVGVSVNLAGGTHHAYSDRGEGFSVLNDIAIASRALMAKNLVERILIVDLDVHQGNGNAAIFSDNPEVFTFSMHGKDNYPLKKEKSDLDIALSTGTDDEEYLELLKKTLPEIIDQQRPNIIFYQSGVDVLESDRLGKLALTKDGCKERDRIVLESCSSNDIPAVIVMGGGYSSRLSDLIDAHCNTMRLAVDIYQ
ncbi:MAG: histone deacetylase [Bacteroidota bacterium]